MNFFNESIFVNLAEFAPYVSVSFTVLSNVVMLVLIYVVNYHRVIVRAQKQQLEHELLLVRETVDIRETNQWPELGLVHSLLVNKKFHQKLSTEALVQRHFSKQMLKLNSYEKNLPRAGMLGTILGIIIFGLTTGVNSQEEMMMVFATALSTTFLGGLGAMWATHIINNQLRPLTISAYNLLDEAKFLYGRKRTNVAQKAKATTSAETSVERLKMLGAEFSLNEKTNRT